MTRTSEVLVAVGSKMEEIRQSLDLDSSCQKLTIEVYFNPGGHVRAAKTIRCSSDEIRGRGLASTRG